MSLIYKKISFNFCRFSHVIWGDFKRYLDIILNLAVVESVWWSSETLRRSASIWSILQVFLFRHLQLLLLCGSFCLHCVLTLKKITSADVGCERRVFIIHHRHPSFEFFPVVWPLPSWRMDIQIWSIFWWNLKIKTFQSHPLSLISWL